MAVNLESGNFSPPHLTRFDDAIDRESTNPGRQRFEKAVSGHYLPQLFERILPDQPGFDVRAGAGALVEYRDQGTEADESRANRDLSAVIELGLSGGSPRQAGAACGAVAEALLYRSADLVAAALAAVIDLYAAGSQVGILAEGSLFWGDPKYAPRVSTTLAMLLGKDRSARVLRLEDANLIGSAAAALSV
jgi:hexokinase